MKFEISIVNKNSEETIIILNNNINENYRCKYNPNAKKLNKEQQNALNIFKRLFNEKYRLVYNDAKTEYQLKQKIIEDIKKCSKTYKELGGTYTCSFENRNYWFDVGGEGSFNVNECDVMVI